MYSEIIILDYLLNLKKKKKQLMLGSPNVGGFHFYLC